MKNENVTDIKSVSVDPHSGEYYTWWSDPGDDVGVPPTGGIKVNIRSWYPVWLVKICTRFSIWKRELFHGKRK